MPILGLTGNFASGKSTVLELLKNKGAVVFDADKRIHRYYRDKGSAIYRKITSFFPQTLQGGRISRKKLAKLVFSDKKKLKKLEAIVHPVIIRDLSGWIDRAKNKKRIYVAEVPLLFENKMAGYFDIVVLIVAKQEVLIRRIIKKYNFSRQDAVNRLSLYLPVREKAKKADFVIDNNLGFKRLEKEVSSLWKKIK